MWKHFFFFNIVVFLLLSSVCFSNESSARQSKTESTRLQNVLEEKDVYDGRILPSRKNDCVREISTEIISSKTLREGIDEQIKKGIGEAFDKNGGKKLLWVSLKVDVERFAEEAQKTDSNKVNLEIYATPNFRQTKIKPIVLVNENGNDWQGNYVQQELLYIVSEKLTGNLFLSAEDTELARFTFSGELADMLMEKARDNNNIFPKIKPIQATSALSAITFYAKSRNLQALQANHMRYFLQPQGIVYRCVDVNLVSGEVLSYPGTHDSANVQKATLSASDLQEIRNILTSKEFIRVTQQNGRIGFDGTSNIIEVDIDGSYLWKIHWGLDDQNYANVLNKINEILGKYGRSFGISLQRGNPGGSFN